MKTLSFPKEARLKSKIAVDRLFDRARIQREGISVKAYLAFPLRAVWNNDVYRPDGYHGHRLMITVPKKKLRHAVDRVTIRRRIREAWRLNIPGLPPTDRDIAILYVASEKLDYHKISAAITKIISKLREQ